MTCWLGTHTVPSNRIMKRSKRWLGGWWYRVEDREEKTGGGMEFLRKVLGWSSWVSWECEVGFRTGGLGFGTC